MLAGKLMSRQRGGYAVPVQHVKASAKGSSASTVTFQIDIPSDDNRGLVVIVGTRNPTTYVSVTGVTAGGTAMTAGPSATYTALSSNPEYHCALFYLTAPAAGVIDIVVTLSGTAEYYIATAALFYGVHQTATIGDTATGNGLSGTTISGVLQTEARNSLGLMGFASNSAWSPATRGSGDTEIFDLEVAGSNDLATWVGSTPAATVGSYTISASGPSGYGYAGVAAELKGAPGPSTAAAGDANYGSVVLLLHCDGADAAVLVTDFAGTPHAATVNGNAQIDTAQSKFGGAALLCDGTGDFVTFADSADWDFGSGDFTIEGWFRRSATGTKYIAGQGDSGGTNASISAAVFINASNQLSGLLGVGSSLYTLTGTTAITSTTTWYHFALVRNGNTARLFLDGVQEATQDVTGLTLNNSANLLAVGALGEYATNPWQGWLDEIRITKGVARYTGNFTPSTAAFPSWAA